MVGNPCLAAWESPESIARYSEIDNTTLIDMAVIFPNSRFKVDSMKEPKGTSVQKPHLVNSPTHK